MDMSVDSLWARNTVGSSILLGPVVWASGSFWATEGLTVTYSFSILQASF